MPILAMTFSMPLATALRYGHVNLEDFNPARLEDSDILYLMERIKIRSDPELTKSYPRKWGARAEIFRQDGLRLEGANDYPKGDPENPLEDREVIEKFKTLTKGMIPLPKAEEIIERVMNLEDMDDVAKLLH